MRSALSEAWFTWKDLYLGAPRNCLRSVVLIVLGEAEYNQSIYVIDLYHYSLKSLGEVHIHVNSDMGVSTHVFPICPCPHMRYGSYAIRIAIKYLLTSIDSNRKIRNAAQSSEL